MKSQRKTAIEVMQQSRATYDRVINAMPPPFLRQATPYVNTDFDPSVRAACANEHQLLDVTLKVAKVVILGDVGTGKTSLVNRFVHQVFSNNYKATIGVDFEVERFDVLDTPFNLQIWDTAGQERFRCIASSYYRGAHAVVLVCDVTNLSTLTHAAQWLQDAQDANPPGAGHDMMVMLVVNKRDMVNDTMFGIVEVKARQMCLSLGAEYWAVSAKAGDCVQDFFRRLAALVFNSAVLSEVGYSLPPTIKISDDLMCDANGNANKEVAKRGGACNNSNSKCG